MAGRTQADRASLRVRALRRRAAVVALRGIPLSWLLKLRAAHLEHRHTVLPPSWRHAVLRLARLRGIPQEEPFDIAGLPGVRIAPADSRIAANLFWLGIDGYEPGEPAWWASLTAAHRSVLELGANIGVYTLAGASRAPVDARYRAVEPNPSSAAALRQNLALNKLGHVDVLQAAAVGKRSADAVTLHFPAASPYAASGGAFINGAATWVRPTASRSISVPVVSVIDLTAGVDLIKLDIEGLELELLQAVRSWIVATTPTLVVEMLDQSRDLQRFLAELVAEGRYVCVAVTDGRPIIVPEQVIAGGQVQKRLGTRDVTLITAERLRDVRPSPVDDSASQSRVER